MTTSDALTLRNMQLECAAFRKRIDAAIRQVRKAYNNGTPTEVVEQLHAAGIRVSLFIEPALEQIDAARRLGAEMVELHTGAFANAQGQAAADELQRLKVAAEHAAGLGLQVNAGHGINYVNIREVLSVTHLAELNIGHSIVSRAVFTGLGPAVADMLTAMNAAPRP